MPSKKDPNNLKGGTGSAGKQSVGSSSLTFNPESGIPPVLYLDDLFLTGDLVGDTITVRLANVTEDLTSLAGTITSLSSTDFTVDTVIASTSIEVPTLTATTQVETNTIVPHSGATVDINATQLNANNITASADVEVGNQLKVNEIIPESGTQVQINATTVDVTGTLNTNTIAATTGTLTSVNNDLSITGSVTGTEGQFATTYTDKVWHDDGSLLLEDQDTPEISLEDLAFSRVLPFDSYLDAYKSPFVISGSKVLIEPPEPRSLFGQLRDLPAAFGYEEVLETPLSMSTNRPYQIRVTGAHIVALFYDSDNEGDAFLEVYEKSNNNDLNNLASNSVAKVTSTQLGLGGIDAFDVYGTKLVAVEGVTGSVLNFAVYDFPSATVEFTTTSYNGDTPGGIDETYGVHIMGYYAVVLTSEPDGVGGVVDKVLQISMGDGSLYDQVSIRDILTYTGATGSGPLDTESGFRMRGNRSTFITSVGDHIIFPELYHNENDQSTADTLRLVSFTADENGLAYVWDTDVRVGAIGNIVQAASHLVVLKDRVFFASHLDDGSSFQLHSLDAFSGTVYETDTTFPAAPIDGEFASLCADTDTLYVYYMEIDGSPGVYHRHIEARDPYDVTSIKKQEEFRIDTPSGYQFFANENQIGIYSDGLFVYFYHVEYDVSAVTRLVLRMAHTGKRSVHASRIDDTGNNPTQLGTSPMRNGILFNLLD